MMTSGYCADNAAGVPPMRTSARFRAPIWLSILSVLLALAPAMAAEVPSWRPLMPSPSGLARVDAGMVYDSARGKMVLFGGSGFDGSESNDYGDTWEWDGAEWVQVATTGPDPRSMFMMAYDSVRKKIVLFGGHSKTPEGGVTRGDTWEWDGSSWARKATTGPSPRERGVMVYDSARGKTVLFGGALYEAEFAFYNDTWEWDGNAWTLVATTGPGPRDGATMAFDAARGKAVLFGGMGEGDALADTWEWDGNAWAEVTAAGPPARYAASIAYDAGRAKVVLFGGGSAPFAGDLNDTWEWDGGAWREAASTGPPPRDGAMMAYDGSRQKTFLYGGMAGTGEGASDTWEWDGAVWRSLDRSPAARVYAAMAFDKVRGKAVLFGGYAPAGGIGAVFGDTWVWDGNTWSNRATTGPSPRTGAAMAPMDASGNAILFGGADARWNTLGDAWKWDGAHWTLLTGSVPPPRYDASMAYDSLRGRVVLFGGYDQTVAGSFHADTWEWDGAAWTRVSTTGPGPRRGVALAYDSFRKKTVLFGGLASSNGAESCLGDTWEWDGAAWTRVATTGPPGRSGASMVYDVSRARVVLFGGETFDANTAPSALNDTWEWDGTSWARVDATGPGARAGASMVYDSARSQTVLFGGLATGLNDWDALGDTWAYGAPSDSFTLGDAAAALRWAGGLQSVSSGDAGRFDVESSGASGGRIDILDALRIARTVVGG